MRADDFLTEGGLVSFLKKLGTDAVDYAVGKAPKVKNWVDTNPQGGLLGGRVPGKPDDVTHVYRNMSPEELEAAKKSGYFDKNPNPDPNIKWDTDKKYWSQGDAEDYFGRAWKDSPENAKVRMPTEKLPRWTAGQTSNAEVLDKATGAWNPVKEHSSIDEKINNDITDQHWRAEKTITLPNTGELILRARNTSHITPPQFVVDVFTPDNKNIGYFRFLVMDWEKPKTGWFAKKSKKDPYVIGGNVSVWNDYQKKGIARAVYQWVKSLGNDIRPSTTQTAAGKSMWRSFEKNPLDEANTSREDFEGITIEMVKNGHVLVINALDDWGNNILGSVAFNIGDDHELDPQDLKVDERYQGQGIARVMYDYAKSKGYKIYRSYDQTDAGKGFWDKHRGEDVRVWENFADGKNPGRKGLAKRMGVNTKASVSDLRKTAKNSSGEKQRMAHWLANMKSGRNKNK